jgi:predicted nuclease of predicted toxin-antitoxin system
MKFMVDECVGPSVADWLRFLGYDVLSSFDDLRGLADDMVLQKACLEDRIVITCDKDFGDMVFRQQMNHYGVILLRLNDERPTNKIRVIKEVIENYSKDLFGNFIVATEKSVRVTIIQH